MKIGLLGHGTIGVGVDHIVKTRNDMEIVKILSLVTDDEMHGRTAQDIDDIVNDPEIDTVVEVMGGIHPAFEFIEKAMKAGKNVTTANKAVVAACYDELNRLAKENGVVFRCTAAVGGGIPWLVNLERANRIDTLDEVGGIMNGTTNFIMNAMNKEGADFGETLEKAQALGYAEKDPSADIDGADIRRKLNISVNAAFGVEIAEDSIHTAGIRNVSADDIEYGKISKKTLKLIASGKRHPDGKVAAYVEPVFLPDSDPMANVPANYNLVSYHGLNCGVQSFIGEGAGRYPTAYNVVQDLYDILYLRPGFYTDRFVPTENTCADIRHRYYIRTSVKDDFLKGITEIDGFIGDHDFIVTAPVSVHEMHNWAKLHIEKDPTLFFAGIREEETC